MGIAHNKNFLKIFFLIIFSGFISALYSQLDNSFLCWDDSTVHKEKNIFIHLKAHHFIKDNEYDSPFALGDTYFGWQLNPEAGFCIRKNLTAEAGFYMPYFYGSGAVWQVYPSLRIRYAIRKAELIAGTLVNSLSHQLTESLYEFEEFLTRRPEYGLQLRYKNQQHFHDLWLDWRKKSFFLSREREHFRAGYSGKYTRSFHHNYNMSVILQSMALHYGGQLDTSRSPSYSDFGFCGGILAEKKFFEASLRLDARFCMSYNQSDVYILNTLPKATPATWLQIIFRCHLLELSGGYFFSRGYRFETANRFMNSLSYFESRNTLYFRERRVFFIRASVPFDLSGLKGIFRTDIIYDNNINRWDYSVGLYLNVEEFISINRESQ